MDTLRAGLLSFIGGCPYLKAKLTTISNNEVAKLHQRSDNTDGQFSYNYVEILILNASSF